MKIVESFIHIIDLNCPVLYKTLIHVTKTKCVYGTMVTVCIIERKYIVSTLSQSESISTVG